MKITKERSYFLIILGIAIAYLLYQLYLFQGQSWESYPYLHQDFWRRMEDAHYYFGLRSEGQFHPPLPSLIYGLLTSLGISQIYFINFLTHAAFGVLIYIICMRFTASLKASLLTAIIYFTNYSLLQQANYLGLHDLTASFLITLGIYLFLIHQNIKHYLILSGTIIGLAILVQYSGIFVVPLMLIILVAKKESLKMRILKLILFAAPVGIIAGSFFVYRLVQFGDPFYSQVEHFGFVKFSFDNVGFYLFSILAFFKLPIVVLSIFGIPKVIRNIEVRKYIFILLPAGLFFILFYSWTDARFMTYLTPVIYILFSYGILYCAQKFVKNSVLIIAGSITFLCLVIYNNLHFLGNFGIITLPNQMIRNDVKYDPIPHNNIISDTLSSNFPVYFLYSNDFQLRAKNDYELQYFMIGTSYLNVLYAKKAMENDSNYVLVLDTDRFVRYHQFSLAYKNNPIMDPDGNALIYTNYIVSDKDLDLINYPSFELIGKFGNLRVYGK